MPLLSCDHVTLRYDRQTAVDNLTFAINSGDYLCVVGENGSGKSSLVKAVLGLIPVASGTIRMDESLKSTQIGYLPQQAAHQRDSPASVQEIVLSGCLNSMGWRPFYSAREKVRAREAMERLGIISIASKSYHALSGGQQRRVLLARALCATRKLLLLDEPAAGLDPLATAELYRMIGFLNREEGITVVMVSHDIPAAVANASHILHLRGSALFFGTAQTYRESDAGRRMLGEAAHD